VVAADARTEPANAKAKAKQSRRGKTAPTYGSYFQGSTVFERHQEGKGISLVTMTGAFLHYGAKT